MFVIRSIFIILFCLFFALNQFSSAVEINDLGTIGFVCEQNLNNLGVEKLSGVVQDMQFTNINIGFNSKLKRNQQLIKQQIQIDDKSNVLAEKRIFIFGTNDQASLNVAKDLKADLGVCVQYKSLSDVENFRNQTGINFPVELGNDGLIEFLKVDSYPVLLSTNSDVK